MLFRTLAAELGSASACQRDRSGVVETPLTQPIINDPVWYQAYADKPILRRFGIRSRRSSVPPYSLPRTASTTSPAPPCSSTSSSTATDGRYDPSV